MKRIFCLLLAFLLVFSATACKGNVKETNPTSSLLTPVGIYEPGTASFIKIQNELYDYFRDLMGFAHITETRYNGTFLEEELVHFAVIQLSFMGEDVEAGIKKPDLERTIKRFFGHDIKTTVGRYLTYEAKEEAFFPQNIQYVGGMYMILRKLTVEKSGLCIAEFDRIPIDVNRFEGLEENEIRQRLFSGNYEEVYGIENIRMTFREHDTDLFGYYIEMLSIDKIEA